MKWTTVPFEKAIRKITYPPKIPKKDFKDEGIFPIVSQEADFINGFWDDESVVFKIEQPVVIFGDHTKVIKYVDFDFVLGADGVKILDPIDGLNAKYLYYYLKSIELPDLGYARHYKLLKELTIAIPPLSEQLVMVSELESIYDELSEMKKLTEERFLLINELERSVLADKIRSR